ncbi:DNA cytosine methyltransferase [Aurantimonas coralicida]|uniref:DNA cytosine methyltransferase n=1 Tax=Aurantimonas coralicida TaxID=182270 RepID=UPI001D190F55|nr:DNA cytosine methyltransferase [Aurantimonas coralicida]MCC4299349.1 DNA cytosine methyltransferase [Aurantimonas coralicida]
MRPLIVDSFAGGGGASTGIEMALGRSPDIAINHNADALAMHEVNHPGTLHLSKNIWQVEPLEAVGNKPVGLAWFSPDCKHFSKAKGGKPVKRNIRDLAWTVVNWAKRARPGVIILENVEEFQTWGPLIENAKGDFVPDPARRGETFRRWVGELKRCGYKVEFRELRACDYGAPTIRKRFFMIARRDGEPIVWPAPTHGAPNDPDVSAGRKLPWRTAAEIIDWSLPCPSIFDTAEEIKAKHGVRAIRPLAEATMRRIARGVVRYVLEAKKPFVVTYGQQGGGNRPPDAPLHTVTASPKDQNAIIVPSFVGCGGRAGQSAPRGGDEPLGTQTAKPDGCVVAATMIQTGYGEREGQAPRALDIGQPIGTQVAGGAKHGVVAAFLAQHNNDSRRIGGVNPGRRADEPLATLTASGAQQQVVAAHMMRQFGESVGHGVDEPCRTDTATVNKSALISGFLTKYYGTGDGARVSDPMHTDTVKDRMGLVTVEIDGATYAIADIGMRMLTPRERFRAQGFPDDYIIDRRADGSPISATVQGSCCGNSVCPPLAKALVAANCGHLAADAPMPAPPPPPPEFMLEAAE